MLSLLELVCKHYTNLASEVSMFVQPFAFEVLPLKIDNGILKYLLERTVIVTLSRIKHIKGYLHASYHFNAKCLITTTSKHINKPN